MHLLPPLVNFQGKKEELFMRRLHLTGTPKRHPMLSLQTYPQHPNKTPLFPVLKIHLHCARPSHLKILTLLVLAFPDLAAKLFEDLLVPQSNHL